MRLGNLPLEIQVAVLRLCSPKDLAVFSRVNTSLRHVAEHVLYSRIDYSAGPAEMAILSDKRDPLALKDDRSLLHTLVAYPRKASIVKTFYIQLKTTSLYDTHTKALQLVLVKLAEALGKMPNLIDFRIVYLPVGDLSEGLISQVIRLVAVITRAMIVNLQLQLVATEAITSTSMRYSWSIIMISKELLTIIPAYNSSESIILASSTRIRIFGQKSRPSIEIHLAVAQCL